MNIFKWQQTKTAPISLRVPMRSRREIGMGLARGLFILYTVQLNARFTLCCCSYTVLHIAHFTKYYTLLIIYLFLNTIHYTMCDTPYTDCTEPQYLCIGDESNWVSCSIAPDWMYAVGKVGTGIVCPSNTHSTVIYNFIT